MIKDGDNRKQPLRAMNIVFVVLSGYSFIY
jgi:hypothetical protein